METVISNFFFNNWQRKLVSLLVALVVWIFVNQSITSSKTISNVPVHVINVPEDKTIKGLLPNGYLEHRLTLTLTGSKDTVDKLEQGDLEVKIDADYADSDNWVVQVTKKNLVSLDQFIDLAGHINSVSHSEFIVQFNNLVSEKIPIFIEPPLGQVPSGYELLDIWPQNLMQTLSGPEEEVERLKSKGLKISFDLSKITPEELNGLKATHTDEVSFIIPKKWKKIAIPFLKYTLEDINDPEAENLRIDFLRKQILPIKQEVQIQIFYPDKYNNTINPTTYSITPNDLVRVKNGITYFTGSLYVKDVSQQFLDIVRENIVIVFIAAPKGDQESLVWYIDLIDPIFLEDAYVRANKTTHEEVLRRRFREYMRKLKLTDATGNEFQLRGILADNKIVISHL